MTSDAFKDESLAEIARVLNGVRDKEVVYERIPEMMRILKTTREQLASMKSERAKMVAEVEELTRQQKEIEDDMTKAYHLLPEGEQTAVEPTKARWLGAPLGFIGGYALGLVLGWYGFFCFLLGLGGVALGIGVGASIDASEHEANKKEVLRKIRERQARDRKAAITLDSGVVVGRELEEEISRVEEIVNAVEAKIHRSLKAHMREKREVIQDIRHLIYMDASILVDENDPEIEGKPCITWEAPRLTIDVDDVLESGSVKLTELLVRNQVSLTQIICFNQGRRIEEQFRANTTIVYSEQFGSEGKFVHLDAPVGEAFNYYLVTEIEYLDFDVSSGSPVGISAKQEVTHAHALVKVKPHKSEEDKLNEKIQSYQVKKREEEFDRQTGQGGEQKSSDDVRSGASDIYAASKAKKERREALEAAIKEAEEMAQRDGFNEEEIEELLEEIRLKFTE